MSYFAPLWLGLQYNLGYLGEAVRLETQNGLSRTFAVTAVAELEPPSATVPRFCARAIGAPCNPTIAAAAASHINRALARLQPGPPAPGLSSE
jgi:hypothetical protein